MLTGKELPSMNAPQSARTRELIDKKNRYVAQGISHLIPAIMTHGKGAVLQDLDGNTYLDFYGGIGVINAGHCPQTVVAAIQEQAEKLLHTCFMVGLYEPYVALAEKLAAITPGNHDKKAMFVNSGAEAVENAVKIAKAHTGRSAVIAFEAAFHGRTLLTMTLTSKVKPYKDGFGPFAPDVYKVPSAYCYRCMFKASYPSCGMACLEHFDRYFVSEVNPETVAAMIIEPVQGEGGFIVPPREFLPGLKEICEKHGIVFIADEVQSGFSRTGKMFAVEHYGVIPDLMTLAKGIASGMPLSAVVGRAEIMDAPTAGRIGGTYGGNPVSCAAALATIDLMEQDNLPGRAESLGAHLTQKLQELQQRYPQIGNIRGLGAMVAAEFVKDPASKEPDKELVGRIIQEGMKRGLLLMGAGIYGNVVRFLPPTVMTDEQLERGMQLFAEALAAAING